MYLFWWNIFLSDSINITFTWCMNQFLHLNGLLPFSSHFFVYQLNFSVFSAINLLSPSILLPSLPFLVLFWMLWLLVTVNKLKHMGYHRPYSSQITTYSIFVTEIHGRTHGNKIKKPCWRKLSNSKSLLPLGCRHKNTIWNIAFEFSRTSNKRCGRKNWASLKFPHEK